MYRLASLTRAICLGSGPINLRGFRVVQLLMQSMQEDPLMSDHYWLSETQIERRKSYFPCSQGVPRVDDRRVLSGIIYVLKRGLQWRDAPSEYGPDKTLCNQFIRWSRMGVFERIFKELSSQDVPKKLQMAALIILHLNQPLDHLSAGHFRTITAFETRSSQARGGLNQPSTSKTPH
jgi:putative transposase